MSFVEINFTVPVDSQVESCVRTWGNRVCGCVGLGFRSICGGAAERDRIMNTKLTAYLFVCSDKRTEAQTTFMLPSPCPFPHGSSRDLSLS